MQHWAGSHALYALNVAAFHYIQSTQEPNDEKRFCFIHVTMDMLCSSSSSFSRRVPSQFRERVETRERIRSWVYSRRARLCGSDRGQCFRGF